MNSVGSRIAIEWKNVGLENGTVKAVAKDGCCTVQYDDSALDEIFDPLDSSRAWRWLLPMLDDAKDLEPRSLSDDSDSDGDSDSEEDDQPLGKLKRKRSKISKISDSDLD